MGKVGVDNSSARVHEIEAGKHVAGKLGEEGYQAGSQSKLGGGDLETQF